MRNGWICLSRRLLDWQWHDEPNMVALWVYLLLRANYEPAKYHGLAIDRGQLSVSLPDISIATGLTIKQVRTCIARLIQDGAITTSSQAKRGCLITIRNYEQYQPERADKNGDLSITQSNDYNPSLNTQGHEKGMKRADKGHERGMIKGMKRADKGHEKGMKRANTTISFSIGLSGDNKTESAKGADKRADKGHEKGQHINNNKEDTSSSSSSREAVVVAPDLSIAPEGVQAAAAQILSDPATQPLILLRAKMPLPDILNALPEFAAQCRLRNQGYKTPQHLAEHLANWLQKKHEYSQPAPTPTLNPNGRAAADPAATAAAEEERHRSVILRAYELMAGGN